MLLALTDSQQNVLSEALASQRATSAMNAGRAMADNDMVALDAYLEQAREADNLQALIADRLVFVGEEGDA